jgi:hypothetical protein
MNLTALKLRLAGLIDPPPAMMKSLGRWVDQTLASHYLALVRTALTSFSANRSEPTEESWKDFWAGFEAIPDQIDAMASQLKPIAVARKPESWDLLVWPDLVIGSMGIFRWDGPEESYGVFYIPGKINPTLLDVQKYLVTHAGKNGIPRGAVRSAVLKAQEKARRGAQQLYHDWKHRQQTRHEPSADEQKLVDLKLLERECLKYTSRAKLYKSAAKAKFKVDLTGWKYESEIDLQARAVSTYANTIAKAKAKLDRVVSCYEAAKKVGPAFVAEAERLEPGAETKRIRVGPYFWQAAKTTNGYDFVVTNPDNTTEYSDTNQSDIGSVVERSMNSWGPEYHESLANEIKQLEKKAPKETRSIAEYLQDAKQDTITAVLWFVAHKRRGGQWSWGDLTLEIDAIVHRTALLRGSFQRTRADAHKTLEHELRHLAQSYLGYLKGVVGKTGLPPPAIREPGVSTHGIPMSPAGKRKPKQIEHPLRDIEFQTDVGNAIDAYKRLVKVVPVREHGALFDAFTGRSTNNKYGTNEFFATWKAKNKAKWQRAVVELYKALPPAGYPQLSSTIGGRPGDQ